jgi:CheY-like chemotaxis protein
MAIHTHSLQHVVASIRHAQPYDWANTYSQALVDASWRATSADPGLEPTRVLIVDDIQTTQSLERLLHELGYCTTRAAVSGTIALEIAQKFSPSIVLLALELPDMSAYDVAWRLREHSELRRVRLIALTGDYEYAYRDLARRAGFERFLAKPVSGPVLRNLLRANLS